jgi:hypothetical protein
MNNTKEKRPDPQMPADFSEFLFSLKKWKLYQTLI